MKSAFNFKHELLIKGERVTLAREVEVTISEQSRVADEWIKSGEFKAVRRWHHNYAGRAANRYFVLGFK